MSKEDLQKARMLLGGYIETDETGLPHTKFLDVEKDARRALVRLLNSEQPVDRQLRTMLADLLDPDSPHQQRSFKFGQRAKYVDVIRNSAIVQWVGDKVRLGMTVTRAQAEVADKINLSTETVKALWRRYKWLRDLTPH